MWGEQEKRKETLTAKIIKKELIANKKGIIIALAVGVLILIPYIWLSFYTFSLIYKPVVWVFAAILFAILFLSLALPLIKSSISLFAILSNKYKISKDVLVDYEEKEYVQVVRRLRYQKTYHFHFQKYGEYVIPAENHKWSQMFSMRAEAVYRYAEKGETYFVVRIGKTIELVYNTRFFEFDNIDIEE